MLDYKELLATASNDHATLNTLLNHSLLNELDPAQILKAKQTEVLEYFMRNADVQGLGDIVVDFIKEITKRRSTDKY